MAVAVDAGAPDVPPWRSVMAGPLVAVVTLVAALIATQAAGVPLRDPDHVAAKYLMLVACSVMALVWLDIAVRAGRRSRTLTPSRAARRSVRRERWSLHRALAVGGAVVSFYVSYMAYRNLKGVIPLLRPGELFDRQLLDFERGLFGGHDPAALLHSLLGTGVQTQVLSGVYVLFIVLLPLSLTLAMVFSRDLQGGLFYATALSINWPLGAASYFMLPALGPVYAAPATFANLPDSKASYLQGVLLDQRLEYLRDPVAAKVAQSIAAFASVHISMIFTAAVVAHLLGLARRLRIGLWALLAVTTVATVYLGWHYVVDDVAGVLIGLAALALARGLTGFKLHTRRPPPSGSSDPSSVSAMLQAAEDGSIR
ncbi:MAG: phosphatase PAP2 family protein [Solirubrobacterales bacterium]|nr:phosphatase PAP2 family protein [Solirubrobacterales bacterium]